jgi:pyrroloquinoline quinone biosynthesis protein B
MEALGVGLRVTPFPVPHRDEYSETVGFRIEGPRRSAVFIPDVDRWERWARPVEEVIAGCDVAFLDGTFFSGDELPGRNLEEIPHPFIATSLRRFVGLPQRERAKVRFIHLNHTNPALLPGSPAERSIRAAGCSVAREGERIGL